MLSADPHKTDNAMRQLPKLLATLIASLYAVFAIAADMPTDSTGSPHTSAPTQPPLVFGPGPVINPENSQYMEEKNAAMEKAQQEPATQTTPNSHSRLHHGPMPPAKNQ